MELDEPPPESLPPRPRSRSPASRRQVDGGPSSEPRQPPQGGARPDAKRRRSDSHDFDRRRGPPPPGPPGRHDDRNMFAYDDRPWAGNVQFPMGPPGPHPPYPQMGFNGPGPGGPRPPGPMFGVPVPMFGPGGPPMRMGPPMPPPPMMGGPPKTRVPPPESLPYQVSFRHFCDYLNEAFPSVVRDKEQLDEAWRKYKLQFSNTQLSRFFQQHAGQAWFRERYAPAEAELRKRLRDQGREGKVEAFVAALEAGEFDEVSFDFVPSEKPAEPVPAPSAEPDPATDGAEIKPDADVDGEDVAVDGDASADAPGDETMDTDEKPAAADVGAVDGAVSGDVDGAAIDGEKPAAASTDAPAANGNAAPTPKPNPQPRRNLRPEIPADELVIIPPNDLQLFIKVVKPEISRVDLEAADGFDYLALSDPQPQKHMNRIGWVNFKPGSDMDAALKLLNENRVNGIHQLNMHKSDLPSNSRMRTAPGLCNDAERMRKDLEQIVQLVAAMEAECDDGRASAALAARVEAMRAEAKASAASGDDEALEAAQNAVDRRAFDMHLALLRNVFRTCYYCLVVCDFPEELVRRCARHLRRPLETVDLGAEGEKPTGDRALKPVIIGKHRYNKEHELAWFKNLDERLILLTDRAKANPVDFGGDNVDDIRARILSEYYQIEDEAKVRCKVPGCNKLFKAPPFVARHIMNKHVGLLKPVQRDELDRIEYFHNFVLDPGHIVPPAPAPPSHGRGPGLGGPPMVGPGFNGFPVFNGPPGFNGPPQRLSDRLGPRMPMGPGPMGGPMMPMGGPPGVLGGPPKRRRVDVPPNAPPPLPPKGMQLDPRAGKQASYNDLDSAAPSGALDDLDY